MEFAQIVLAVAFLALAALATRPVYLLLRLRATFGTLPDSVARREVAARSVVTSSIFIAAVLLVARFAGWPLPSFLLIVGTLYLSYSLVTTMIVWSEASRTRAGLSDPEWERTPFDALDEKPFDLFVSYKSEDVHVARWMADRFIAAGLRVWFAEYIVLLVARERFEEAIDNGISHSRFGVILSNDRYVASSHCRRELDQLLHQSGPGIHNLIEVRIPSEPATHRYNPTLAECRAIDYDGDPCRVTRFILENFVLPGAVPPDSPPTSAPAWLRDERRGYALNVTDWQVDDRSTVGSGAIAYRRSVEGRVLKVNLHVGTGTVAPRPITTVLNEREVFDRSVEFASSFLSHHGRRCAGVHLFFLGGYSHLVVAYWLQGCWERRYSIVLPDPKSGQATEFAFAFGFFGPFREYLLAVPLMDRLVQSLAWS